MSLHVEVSYDINWKDEGEWMTIIVDEDERIAGERSTHRLRSDALKSAKQYNMPIYIYKKSDQLYKIIQPPFRS